MKSSRLVYSLVFCIILVGALNVGSMGDVFAIPNSNVPAPDGHPHTCGETRFPAKFIDGTVTWTNATVDPYDAAGILQTPNSFCHQHRSNRNFGGHGNTTHEPYSAQSVWDNESFRFSTNNPFDRGHGFINEWIEAGGGDQTIPEPDGQSDCIPDYYFSPVNETGHSVVWPAEAQARIIKAFNQWGAIESDKRWLETGIAFEETPHNNNAEIVIYWQPDPNNFGVFFPEAWPTKLTFDSSTNWFFNVDPTGIGQNEYHFYTIALHETGHVVGFDHQNDPGDLMYTKVGYHIRGGDNKTYFHQGPDAGSIEGVRDLYSIPAPDFGDATDPAYPTRKANNGARNLFIGREWLGPSTPPQQTTTTWEWDKRPVDNDNGVVIDFHEWLIDPTSLKITVTIGTSEHPLFTTRYVAGVPEKLMHLNAWIDWGDKGFWVVADHIIYDTFYESTTKEYIVDVPEGTNEFGWARFRLDYGENVNSWLGIGRYGGEVEDYKLEDDWIYPVDTQVLYVAHAGIFPSRADPINAHDTGSRELIFNIYDTLISMGKPVTNDWGTWDVHEQYWEFSPSLATNVPPRENIMKTVDSTDVNLADPTGSTWSDGSTCIGWVDNNATDSLDASDILYMIEAGGSYRTWYVESLNTGPPVSVTLWRGRYTFQIRTDPIINFVNETGHIVDTFDVYDAEYSFKRGLVQDQIGSPMWMFYKPFFDQMNSDFFDSSTTEPTAMSLAHLIDDAIEVSGNDLTVNVGIPFPDIAFKQIMCGTWASIVSKQFSINIGCWNGNLYEDVDPANGYPDWWDNERRKSYSPYDTTGEHRYAGTGPYRVVTLSQVENLVVLQRNEQYWNGWPAPGRKDYLESIQIEYVKYWPIRRGSFLSGQYDIIDVPRAYMEELLDEYGHPLYEEMITIKNIYPGLTLDAVHFAFKINLVSSYIGSRDFPEGIPVDFFNNTHCRKAFAYAFNRTHYVMEGWMGEANCRDTPLISGLVPDFYSHGPDPPWVYDIDYDAAEAELKAAIFNGTSVWDSGFTLTIPYVSGDEMGAIACNILRDFFGNLSTYDSRIGPPFTVEVTEVDWLTYMYQLANFELPIFTSSAQAEFADVDNFARSFMHSHGDLACLQKYSSDNGWGTHKDELIDLALNTLDGPERAALYAELQDIYIMDCPSIPIAEPIGRRWQKYWVKGWYHNALYPSDYYYHLYKEDTCWCDVTGPDFGVPDGVDNMRDIAWIVDHFGASPPDVISGYDPLWAPGTYGYAGCDVYGDRKVDMRDIGLACAHFMHTNQP